METIKHYTNLAFKILEDDNTSYKRGKKIISEIFKIQPNENLSIKDVVILRLSVIDSYYSTQMSKRIFGIEYLAEEISKFKSDEDLKKDCNLFLDNPKESIKISEIFEKNYGIQKDGRESGQAASLISKYLYFLTSYKFPIYDSLAIDSYKIISEYKNLRLTPLNTKFNVSYFESMNSLNRISEINDYNKLDNFLWLIGKIRNGSFSLILDEKNYKRFLEEDELKKRIEDYKNRKRINKKSKESLNDVILDYLKNDIPNNIFNSDLVAFINFSLKLN